MIENEYANIRVTRATVQTLKEIGWKSETYDDIINRLIYSEPQGQGNTHFDGNKKELKE